MKVKITILSIGALAILFFVSTGFRQNASDAQYSMQGYYKTYDDFVQKNLTKQEIVAFWDSYYPVVDGKKGKETRFKLGTIWGCLDKQGFPWYIETKEERTYRIMLTGKIWVYTTDNVQFVTNKAGKVTSIQFTTTAGHPFKQIVWISAGPNTELLKCSEDNLMKVLADDSKISTKVKAKGIYESRNNKWGESLSDVLGWVKEYNDKHN
jgi:hypothetical protein